MMASIKKVGPVDRVLLVLGILVALSGMVSLYSASAVESYHDFGSTSWYISHQLMYGGLIGIAAATVLARTQYRKLIPYAPWLMGIGTVLLVLVFIPGIGTEIKGATRWLAVGSFSFQPAEFVKLAVVCYLAAWVDRRQAQLGRLGAGAFIPLVPVLLCAVLIIAQPDFGTMAVLVAIAFSVLFGGGMPLRYFAIAAGVASLLLMVFVVIEPYRLERVRTFMGSNVDTKGAGYQSNQAIIAVGSGGSWGTGYGLSKQKYRYLPEVIGDSVFAVTAEELGFFRTTAILLLELLFVLRGLRAASRAEDSFGRSVATGITTWFAVQTVVNIGAMVGLIPLTGIPLPFFSYGSSALVLNLAAFGLLLSVSRTQSKTVASRAL